MGARLIASSAAQAKPVLPDEAHEKAPAVAAGACLDDRRSVGIYLLRLPTRASRNWNMLMKSR